jgi:hypothetical protein
MLLEKLMNNRNRMSQSLSNVSNKRFNIEDFDNFNYLEIIILPYKNNNLRTSTVIDINWTKTKFDELLEKFIKNSKMKFFEKKRYIEIYEDKYLVNEISTMENKNMAYKQNLLNRDYYQNGKLQTLITKSRKDNISIIEFPSSDKIDDEYYSNTITFIITNTIYLNFEIRKKLIKKTDDNDNEILDEILFRRIYINYNNKKNVDRELVINKINDTLNKLN